MSEIFAVVVTWNGERYVPKCIGALKQSRTPVQVVVVDNASTDSTLRALSSFAPETTVFPLTRNLGFGRANNIGIKYAFDNGARHVLLINQDAYVGPDIIKGLIELQRSSPKFGIVSPLHLNRKGDRLDVLFREHLARSIHKNDLLNDALLVGSIGRIYSVDFVNAAIWMMSRECIEKVGLFNPAFEHYGEDKEYADRVKFHGLRIGLAPAFYCIHDRLELGSRGNRYHDAKRFLMQEKAIIKYRLSRKSHSLAFNMASSLTRAIFSAPPSNTVSRLESVSAKVILMISFFYTMPLVLKMKKIAYEGGRCFFEKAESDRTSFLDWDEFNEFP